MLSLKHKFMHNELRSKLSFKFKSLKFGSHNNPVTFIIVMYYIFFFAIESKSKFWFINFLSTKFLNNANTISALKISSWSSVSSNQHRGTCSLDEPMAVDQHHY